MPAARRYLSARVSPRTLQRLERRARLQRRPKSSLVEQYIEEALRMDEHPGIVFVEGPAGRRPALRRGPDVWEAVTTLRANHGSVADTATALALPESQVRIALAYYAEHVADIDDWIAANEEEAERAEAAWRRERALTTD